MTPTAPLDREGVAKWLDSFHAANDGMAAPLAQADAVIALVEAKVREAIDGYSEALPSDVTPLSSVTEDRIVSRVLSRPLASPVEGEAVAFAVEMDGAPNLSTLLFRGRCAADDQCADLNRGHSVIHYRVVPLYAQASPSPSRLAAALLREAREYVVNDSWDTDKQRYTASGSDLLARIDAFIKENAS